MAKLTRFRLNLNDVFLSLLFDRTFMNFPFLLKDAYWTTLNLRLSFYFSVEKKSLKNNYQAFGL